MKIKILFSTALLVLFMYSLNAQVIPNYNFETWTNGPNSSPDGWVDHGSNHAGFYPATQTTDKYLGTYAVRIENKITATDTTYGTCATIRPNGSEGFGPAFPISVRYNTLKGFYKYIPINGDSVQIIVYLTKTGFSGPWGNLLAWGQGNLGAAATYTPFSVGYLDSLATFIYNDNFLIPDSGYISLAAYKSLGGTLYNLKPLGNSVLFVDVLNFDSFITGIKANRDITTNFALFPNANNGIFDVKFNTSENDFTTIKLFDMAGKEIINLYSGLLTAGDHEFHYALPELINGNYLYVVASEKGYRAENLSIQK
jgi:hypothetical protein